MRIREDYTEESAVAFNVIALIDIVFFLLIFFLAATTFAREERENAVQLPGTTMQPLSAAPQEFIVNILADGTIKVGGRACTFDELADELGRVARQTPNRQVLIRADRDSRHFYFAEVAKICRLQGINPLNIGYIAEQATPAAVQ